MFEDLREAREMEYERRNKQSKSKEVHVVNKQIPGLTDDTPMHEAEEEEEEDETESTEINQTLKKKLENIHEEMQHFAENVNEFARTCDTQFDDLLKNVETFKQHQKKQDQ